jgi:hypothetical protein
VVDRFWRCGQFWSIRELVENLPDLAVLVEPVKRRLDKHQGRSAADEGGRLLGLLRPLTIAESHTPGPNDSSAYPDEFGCFRFHGNTNSNAALAIATLYNSIGQPTALVCLPNEKRGNSLHRNASICALRTRGWNLQELLAISLGHKIFCRYAKMLRQRDRNRLCAPVRKR